MAGGQAHNVSEVLATISAGRSGSVFRGEQVARVERAALSSTLGKEREELEWAPRQPFRGSLCAAAALLPSDLLHKSSPKDVTNHGTSPVFCATGTNVILDPRGFHLPAIDGLSSRVRI